MKTATPQTTTEKPRSEKPTLNTLELIDVLNQIDVELRKARQVISEFYDDIVVDEAHYPSLDDVFSSRTPNNLIGTPLFKLVNDYPRYVTLLDVAAGHLTEGHSVAINALVNAGHRENNRSYVIG